MLGIQKRCPYCGCWIRFEYLDLCQLYGHFGPRWRRECNDCHNLVYTPLFWEVMTVLVPLAAAFGASLSMLPQHTHPSRWMFWLASALVMAAAYLLTGIFRHLVLFYVELVEPWGWFAEESRRPRRT